MRAVSARTAPLEPSLDEREACADELRWHFEHGNLEARDLEMRLVLVDRAATLGELRRLRADMPKAGSRLSLARLIRR